MPTTARIGIVAMAALALTACAAGGGGGTPDPETGVGGGAVDAPALTLACADLGAGLDAAYGSALPEVPLSFDGSATYYVLSQIGLARAGAVRCEWSDGGASGPEKYATLSVLPEAADDWAAQLTEIGLVQNRVDELGDASRHQCSTFDGRTSCRVDALSGERWVSAVLSGVIDEGAALDAVRGILAMVAGAAAGPLPAAGSAPGCAALADDAAVSTALGGPVALTANPGPVQPAIYHAGFLAAGGTHCYWRGSLDAAQALAAHAGILPGGGSAWDAYFADAPGSRVDRAPVDGLGDAAYAGCVGDRTCFAAARVGDTWAVVDVTSDLGDSRDRAVELVRVLIAGL